MFENEDGKEFKDVSQEMGGDFLRMGFQRGSAFADLNNDGFMDIVVTSLNQKPRILMNSAATAITGCCLRLTGRKSNRDAIGAKIKVTTPSGRTLYNHVTGQRRIHVLQRPPRALRVGRRKPGRLDRDPLAERRYSDSGMWRPTGYSGWKSLTETAVPTPGEGKTGVLPYSSQDAYLGFRP